MNTIEKTTNKDKLMFSGLEDKLKKIHLVFAIIVILIVQFFSPTVKALIDKNSAETSIKNHEYRITKLEEVQSSDKEWKLEIKFNLRSLMEALGQKYIELGTKEK